jgi:two-component system phosphate regulon sensor histidine kinase PhoR
MRLNQVWKLYIVFTIVLVISMTVGGFILDGLLKKQLKNHLRDDILTLTKVIGAALPDTEDASVLDSFCQKYRELADVRVTIIKDSGEVIGESDRASVSVANHLERPEVREALENGTGNTIRFSRTLNMDMFYVALHLEKESRIVRVAMSMTKVKQIENEVMVFLALILYLTPVLAIVISFFFAESVDCKSHDMLR